MSKWGRILIIALLLLEMANVEAQFMTKEEYEETKGGTQKRKVDPLADLNAELKLEGYAVYKNPEFANERRKDGLTKLMAAALRPDKGIVKHLVAQGADTELTNEKGDTALLMAVSKGHYYPAAELLKGHANMHHRNKKGMNTLHTAIAGGQLVIVEAILASDEQLRYSVDFREDYIKKPFLLDDPLPTGQSPLMMACQQGETKMVEKLLAYGAEINLRKKGTQETALMYASIIGHDGLVNILLDHGADAHAQNSMGFTALMYAAHRGHESVVRTFLRLINSDLYRHLSLLDARDEIGSSALDHAVQERERDVIDELMAAGAEVGRVYPRVSPEAATLRKVALQKINAKKASQPVDETDGDEEAVAEAEAPLDEEDDDDDGYEYDDENDEEYEGEDEGSGGV